MEQKIIRGKSLTKIDAHTTYRGCTFYLKKINPNDFVEVKFDNCSFRGETELCLEGEHEISQWIFLVLSLVTFKFIESDLRAIPINIVRLTNLTELVLCSNSIEYIPAEIGQLKNLTQLYLSKNNLQEIPYEIVDLPNLTHLYLDGNKLREIPMGMGNLKNLKKLYLNENRLQQLPKQIGELTKLVELDLYNNQLETIPPQLAKLKNLQRLDLRGNSLKEIPEEVVVNLWNVILVDDNVTFTIPLLRELTEYWGLEAEGIYGATVEELIEFEDKHELLIPPQLKLYLRYVEGPNEYTNYYEDDKEFRFWDLKRIRLFLEGQLEQISIYVPDEMLCFADYLNWDWGYAISIDPENYGEIFLVTCGDQIKIADSLFEFIEFYLEDTDEIYGE
ncbi:leucine-rich repeat domain-containing protein [Candidatus Uabimicrobium sp. HlEnr_7]|uniref:leucine-rich repeat domain-containing protein n=1 Tax=Candidatus Uabimicrobium helgolandensis TaxID=3095367 RepID=UPI00355717A2